MYGVYVSYSRREGPRSEGFTPRFCMQKLGKKGAKEVSNEANQNSLLWFRHEAFESYGEAKRELDDHLESCAEVINAYHLAGGEYRLKAAAIVSLEVPPSSVTKPLTRYRLVRVERSFSGEELQGRLMESVSEAN